MNTKALLAEFFGTFSLMLAILLVVINQLPYPWLIVGVALTGLVYLTGPISGAHLNPAITVGFWVRQKIGVTVMVQYVLVQIAAAFLAYLVCNHMLGMKVAGQPAAHSLGLVFLGEFLGSFALASVIWAVATLEITKGNKIYGAAIGGIVAAGMITIGGWSTTHFNPSTLLSCVGAGLTRVEMVSTVIGGAVLASILSALLFNEIERRLEIDDDK